jgi:hypothetical protein
MVLILAESINCVLNYHGQRLKIGFELFLPYCFELITHK